MDVVFDLDTCSIRFAEADRAVDGCHLHMAVQVACHLEGHAHSRYSCVVQEEAVHVGPVAANSLSVLCLESSGVPAKSLSEHGHLEVHHRRCSGKLRLADR